MLDAVTAREDAKAALEETRRKTLAHERRKEFRYMEFYGASPRGIAARANLHKRRASPPNVICLPDQTPEGEVIRRLVVLWHKLEDEGLYVSASTAFLAADTIEKLRLRGAS